jgi:MoaA/NifB/PqqE/SkfB family radical SAM enzyme
MKRSSTYTDPEGRVYTCQENDKHKMVLGPDYRYMFDKRNGSFERCGDRIEDDPQWSPMGPELLDLEISVNGCPNRCRFCYKGNTDAPATNMSLATFKGILDRMPHSLTQIAFGITGVQTNPAFIPMMEESRARGVIPNFTLSGIDLTPELADRISKLAGALAVSLYEKDLEPGLKAIEMFTDRGMTQVNVHLMVSQETLPFVQRILEQRAAGGTVLDRVHAFVFLGVKPKGRAAGHFHSLTKEQFQGLVKFALGSNVPIGFDSCSAPKFEAAVKALPLDEQYRTRLIQCSESCESGLFSSYINVEGKYFPCSFSEGVDGIEGVPVLDYPSFMDVWYSPPVKAWRERILSTVVNGCRHCPLYPEINE